MSESAPETPGQNVDMSKEIPQVPIEIRQVENAMAQAAQRLKGEFAGNPAIREEDVKKAVEQAAGGSAPPKESGVFRPVAIEETVSKFGQIRTDEKGKPLFEDLPESVKAVRGVENVNGPGEPGRPELSPEERARLEAEREYRRAERVHSDEILYYSPEQVGLLLTRRIDSALVYLQEHGEYPSEFNYGVQRELFEIRKVIESEEEMLYLTPEQRVMRGYPELNMDDLVKMGGERMNDFRSLVRVDQFLAARRMLQGKIVLEEREQKQLDAIEGFLGKQARDIGLGVDDLEKWILQKRQEGLEVVLPERIEQLKKYERALLGFADLLEFYQLQKDLAPSARGYHDILEERNKSQRGKDPPAGIDYQSIFECPPVIEGAPDLGDLVNVAFNKAIDVLDSEKPIAKISFRDPLFGQQYGDIDVFNIYASEPSDVPRWALMNYVQKSVLEYTDESGRGLDSRNKMHQLVANTAARLAMFFIHHWDIHASYATKESTREGEEGEFSLEVTYTDMPKMHFPAVRAQNELASYNASFGNNMFTGASFNLTSDFLRVTSLNLNEDVSSPTTKDPKTGKMKATRHRIPLWSLLRDYGMRLRDIPWTRPEISLSELPPTVQDSLREVEHRGERRNWVRLSGSRNDAFMIPYALQLDYIGAYYDALLAQTADARGSYLKLASMAMNENFWQGFNKPFDTGFKIFLGGQGFNEETVYKLILLAKVNLAASIWASVELGMEITEQEKVVFRGGGLSSSTIHESSFFNAVFDARFLGEKIPEKIIMDEGVYPLNLRERNVKGLIKSVAAQKRGLVPGDEIIKNLFTEDEIAEMEEVGIYYPFDLRDRKSQKNIVVALERARDKPKPRA